MVIQRLFKLRNRYDSSDSDEKLALLRQLAGIHIKAARDIKRLHSALCFIRAFPDSTKHYRFAHAELSNMQARVDVLPDAEQLKLWDTGIVGTPVHYQFSYEVARWLQRRAPGAVSIDWEEADDPPGLDEILEHVLQPADEEYFRSGYISGKEWLSTHLRITKERISIGCSNNSNNSGLHRLGRTNTTPQTCG